MINFYVHVYRMHGTRVRHRVRRAFIVPSIIRDTLWFIARVYVWRNVGEAVYSCRRRKIKRKSTVNCTPLGIVTFQTLIITMSGAADPATVFFRVY